MFSMSVDRVLLNQIRGRNIKNQKTLPPMYLFLISMFCFVRLLFHNQDTNSSSAPKQVCRTCRFRILSFPTMHQPVVGSRAKKGASNSQSLEDPLLSSCRRPLLLLLRRPRSERPSSCTAVKRPSSLCGVFRGEGCEEKEEEEAGTLCMCVCILRGRHEAAAARCKQQQQ